VTEPIASHAKSELDNLDSNGEAEKTPSAGQLSPRADLEREVLAFLTLAAIRGVGLKSLSDLADEGRRFADVLEEGPADFLVHRASGRRDHSRAHWGDVLRDAKVAAIAMRDRLSRMGVHLIFRHDPHFPRSMLDLERPPHWLFVQGAMKPLTMPAVAIVGTRKPSEDGLFLARYVGACLGDWKAATVSGLAAGIDQLAHESSLRAGVPTIAVLGTGILDNYPKGSDVLRKRILDAGGTIISEYLPRASYSAENFVQRNRLQAALGSALIPVEWAQRSGTAHTVRFAMAIGRPIACLRLAEWPPDRLALNPGLGGAGAIFTVPREQNKFDCFIRAALGSGMLPPAGQLSLFEED
jgi:DNA protecting protein DprA